MADIYENTPGYEAYELSKRDEIAPIDVPPDAQVYDEKLAGNRVVPETGFLENIKAEFIQSYRRVGMGSYIDYEDEAYSEAYRKLGAEGHLKAMGLENILPIGVSPKYLYDANRDVIDKYIREHPELNLKSPEEIEQERQRLWEEEAKQAAKIKENASFFAGNAGWLSGMIFGSLTDPLQLALAAVPGGTIAKGATIASQIPNILSYSLAAAGVGSIATKARDLKYRQEVLKEDIGNVNVPLEIAAETVAGGLIGTGLTAGLAGIGRGVSKAFDSLNPFNDEVKQSLEQLTIAKKMQDANPGNPEFQMTGEQEDALYALQSISDSLADVPKGVSQAEFVRKLSNAQAELISPAEAIADLRNRQQFGGQISQDEAAFLKRMDEDPFRMDPIPPQARDTFDAAESLQLKEINDKINDLLTVDAEHLTNYKINEMSVPEYVDAFKKEQSAIEALQFCLTTPKPRVRAQ